MDLPGVDQLPPAIGAALAGGATGALTMEGSLLERIAAGVAGASCSLFVAPVAAPFFYGWFSLASRTFFGGQIQVEMTHVLSFTGFLLGVTGMAVVAGAQRLMKSATRRANRLIEGG
jgi:hypothetical protein